MFEKSPELYDFVYSFKDYEAEAEQVHQLIQAHQRTESRTLLDVACGTGHHLVYLRNHHQAMGLDLDEGLLAVARERLPDVTFHQGDMQNFDLGQSFDAITCLFGSIGYLLTVERLQATFGNFAKHLNPGGVLVIEPFIQPSDYIPGRVSSLHRAEGDLHVSRFVNSTLESNIMVMNFHYLVGTPQKIDYFTETHRMALFTREEIIAALETAGFVDIQTPPSEVFGRGIYVAVWGG